MAIYVSVAGAVTLVGLALGRNPNTAEDEEYRLLLEGESGNRRAAGDDGASSARVRSQQEVPGDRQMVVDGLLSLCGITGHQSIEDALVFGAHRPGGGRRP